MKITVTVVRTECIDVEVDNTLAKEILENFKNHNKERSARIRTRLENMMNEHFNVSDWEIDSKDLPSELVEYKPMIDAWYE